MRNRFFTPKKKFKIKDFISSLGGEVIQGNAELIVDDVKPLDQAEENHLSFLTNRKYFQQFLSSNAGACIIDNNAVEGAPTNMTLILAANPYAYYARVMEMLYPRTLPSASIGKIADIDKSASIGDNTVIENFVTIKQDVVIGKNCHIMAGSYIGANVQIGDNVTIYPNVVIECTVIGENVTVKSGAQIGQEGFGFATDVGKHIKIRHVGQVIIGNNVEIGSGTTIDRGSQGDTIIGDGVMIDNLVQIGHNVIIGAGSVIVSQVGIAGSTELGKYCVAGGQVGFAGHLKIADRTTFLGATKVAQSIEEPGKFFAGCPAMDAREWQRLTIMNKQLVKQRRRNAGSES